MKINIYCLFTWSTLYTQLNGPVEPYKSHYIRRRNLIKMSPPVLRRAELLQGAVQGLELLPHLAQGVLDFTGLIQDLHAAGEGVIADCEGALDVCRVFPVHIKQIEDKY